MGCDGKGGDAITTAVREWLDPAKAPSGEVARLRVVQARTEDGRIADEISIRQPFKIEIEYEVLKPGYVLLPNLSLFNEEGIHVLSTHDIDPTWRRCPRQIGRYVGTVHIPANLLTEGLIYVGVGLETMSPSIYQFYEPDAIVFCVIDDSFGSDDGSARGDYAGHIAGVVRPLLKWSNQYMSNECFSVTADEG